MRPDAVLGHVTEGEAALEVVAVGVQATVQDLGRPLGGALGVPLGGAADRAALRLANRLVGNPEGLAGLEILLGGLDLMVHAPVVVALVQIGRQSRALGFELTWADEVELTPAG